tara:strand:+ start:305 stop:652 length:348 start_codon:yes stop_codon:yes gene_type:complete
MNPNNPRLIESGARYFFKETLRNVNKQKKINTNISINVGLFLVFVIVMGLLLVYKYYTKPTEEEKNEKEKLKKTYLLNKIKELSDKKKAEYDKMITNLPKFESNFDLLHKKFYFV